MTLGFPLGLLALFALVPLVGAYFLRRRQRPRTVSALFLWRTPNQRAQAGPRFQRFSRELSLLLETLAVCAGALFLADARCGGTSDRHHVVVVVDGGLSMQAKQKNGQPVAELVRRELARVAEAERATQLTVVESGVKATVLAGPQADVTRALAAVEKWGPVQPAHDVMPALLLGRELAGGKGQKVFFLTDGPLPDGVPLPPEVQVKSLAEAEPNVALVSAQRSDVEGTASVTVRVANFSTVAATVPLEVKASDGTVPARVETLELAPGQSGVVRLNLETAGTIVVSLPDDALPLDGRVTLLPSPPQLVAVGFFAGVEGAASSVLQRALAVTPGVTLPTEQNVPLQLSFGGPASSAKVTFGTTGTPKSFVGPFFTEKSHPALEDVQLAGVVWTGGDSPPGHPLVTAGERALVTEDDDGRLHFNLDLSRSNVQRTPAWPVLVGNLVRRARVQAPGLPRRHLMLGEEIPVTTAAGKSWVLSGPDGSKRAVLGAGPVRLPPATAPGRWVLTADGEEVDALEVLPLDPRESDLRTRGAYTVEASVQQAAVASLGLQRPRVMWPLVVLLLLLLVDFWLTTREAT